MQEETPGEIRDKDERLSRESAETAVQDTIPGQVALVEVKSGIKIIWRRTANNNLVIEPEANPQTPIKSAVVKPLNSKK